MIALVRKAGKREFSDDFVGSAAMQSMQKRITTELDPEIEKMGFDKMRSRIVVRLKNGQQLAGWADERYRGGPENPLSDRDLEAKVHSCCEDILNKAAQSVLIDAAWSIVQSTDVSSLMKIINGLGK
jgi:2-methylcitrate dehydratase PrpD